MRPKTQEKRSEEITTALDVLQISCFLQIILLSYQGFCSEYITLINVKMLLILLASLQI